MISRIRSSLGERWRHEHIGVLPDGDGWHPIGLKSD